jgi:lipopolysaccharide export system protein LptC
LRIEASTHFTGEGTGSRHAASFAVRRARQASILFKVMAFGLVTGLAAMALYAAMPRLWQGPIDVTLAAPEHPGQAASYGNDVKGLDKEQKPFRITASRGVQDAKNKDIVHLETFTGTFARESGKDLQVTSQTGVYNSGNKILDLSGDVVISDGPGFRARMDKAQFDVDKRSLMSQAPVTVKTENGDIAADSLVSDNNGERMVFRGNVKASFNRPAAPEGGKQ